MTWLQKQELLNKDPIKTAMMFQHMVLTLLSHLRRSDCPLGKMTDYFYRIESQKRGKLHLHVITYHENSVDFIEGKNEDDVVKYVDQHISCQQPVKNVQTEDSSVLYELVELQKHRHRKKSCFSKHKRECRFGFPKPPMLATKIMHPNNVRFSRYSEDEEVRKDFKRISKNWNRIYNVGMLG